MSELAPESAKLMISNLLCEGLDSPTCIDTDRPRFSWQLATKNRNCRQSAYQLRVGECRPETDWNPALVTYDRVESDQSHWVSIPEIHLSPKTRFEWQVRVWDNRGHDSGWSPKAIFETGLMGTEWQADWISDGRKVKKKTAPPARYFKKSFRLDERPARARLYLSAFGLADPWLNGRRVTEDLFLPGWPDYRKRNFYVSYDVTEFVESGENTVGIVLGDGWYSGTLFLEHQYDPTPKVSSWIEIVDTRGKIQIVSTDKTWDWAEGPIVANGVYFGETYDARQEDRNWCRPHLNNWSWKRVVVEPKASVPIEARHSQPVRRIEEIVPSGAAQISPRVFLYDLGQNMVGWVRLKVRAEAGQEIRLRFAEMLDADGGIFVDNLREAEATARYIAKGEGTEIWEPTFTFFGFRYVEVSGLDEPLEDAITGIVIHSNLPRTGHFECSNPLINQLYSNTLWGQKGNFLELPTDCPQRDERLGWTGDAQVFCNTAHYNLSSGPFFRQWMAAVRDSFEEGENGGYGSVAPYIGFDRGAAGWSDAGVIVPWITWLHTGDRRILEENFATIQRHVAQLQSEAPEGIRYSKEGWGDWLAPGHAPKEAPTPYVLIATAYYAYSVQLAARVAEVLEELDIAREYNGLLEKIRSAFQRKFIEADGRIASDEQTAYLLALGFDLVSDELRPRMIECLVRAMARKDNHLATGFLGTPLLAPVLSEIGRTDLAYSALLKETYPGWLFSVKNGATTIWERWDSWTPENGFNEGGMNSFNHYAYGSIVSWFFDTIAGIKPDPEFPGWKQFEVAPYPGGGLTHAKASVETPYGLAVSDWRMRVERFELKVVIPPNSRAKVSFPAKSIETTLESGMPLTRLKEAENVELRKGRISFYLASGEYHFTTIFPAGKTDHE